eukprot:SAG22_NODE_493_length_9820_cov_53.085588_9_plen_153_part_00
MRTTMNVAASQIIRRISLADKMQPDIDPPLVAVLVLSIAVGLVCIVVKLSVRVSSLHDVTQASMGAMVAADTIKYFVAAARNVVVLRHVRGTHLPLANGSAFGWRNMLYDSTIGRQGGIVMEVAGLLGMGLVFQYMAFSQIMQVGTTIVSLS